MKPEKAGLSVKGYFFSDIFQEQNKEEEREDGGSGGRFATHSSVVSLIVCLPTG